MSNLHADPCVLVIFGASGDLTRRKLLPTIYNLAEDALLPQEFTILGVARPPIDESAFRAEMRRAGATTPRANRSKRPSGSASRIVSTTSPASLTMPRCSIG